MSAAAEATPSGVAAEEQRLRDAYARRAEVDERYSWFGPGYVFAMQRLERALLTVLKRELRVPLAQARLLEVGCGRGAWIQRLVSWGATPECVAGVDVLADRIAAARSVCAPGVELRCASATALPFPPAAFDVVLQVTAFTSMLDPEVRARAAAEVLRVLAPGGAVVWYDFHVDNPRNRDVRGVPRAEVARLFPGCDVRLTRATLAPPLARWLAPRVRPLAAVLDHVPMLCTHLVGSIVPRPGQLPQR